MYTAGASQAVRDAFGLFWRKKSGKRLPPELKGVSFTNATTFSTRVRLRVLKELSRRHQLANPNISCYVTNYLARPELKIRDRRGMVTSLSYIQAVQQLPHHLTLSFLRDLYQYARTNLPETNFPPCLNLPPHFRVGQQPPLGAQFKTISSQSSPTLLCNLSFHLPTQFLTLPLQLGPR